MINKKSINAPLLGIVLAVAVTAGLAITLFAVKPTVVEAVTTTPVFNKGSRSGGPFMIQKPDGTRVPNVSGHGQVYERNFVRVGNEWSMQGDYSNGGNRLEVCTDNAKVTLWVYVHNTVSSKYNHSDRKTNGKLDFKGSAVAKNTKVAVAVPGLNDKVFRNEHVITGGISADNATTVEDTAVIYCDDRAIALKTTSTTPLIHTWANVATYDNQVKKHRKAVEAFGSEYGLYDANQIFANGSKVGYNGNLPSCRYYGAYVQIELTVVHKVKEKPQEDPAELPAEAPALGIVDGVSDGWLLGLIVATTVGIGATVSRLAYARRRQ